MSTVSQGVQSVNEAIQANDADALLAALMSLSTGLQSVKNECGQTYLDKLSELQKEKASTGVYFWSLCVHSFVPCLS